MDTLAHAHHRAKKALNLADDAREIRRAAEEEAMIALGQIITDLVPTAKTVQIDGPATWTVGLGFLNDHHWTVGLVLTDDGDYVTDAAIQKQLDKLDELVTLAVAPFLADKSRYMVENLQLRMTFEDHTPVLSFAPEHF